MVETLNMPSKHRALTDLTLKVNTLPNRDSVLVALGEYERLQAEKAALSKREKMINQRLKNSGGQIDAFKAAMSYKKHKDGDRTCINFLAHLQHYLQIFKMPVGTQLGLFADPTATEDTSHEAKLQAAYDAGYDLGLLAKDPDWQAYHQNTDLGQQHEKGWQAGQDVHRNTFLQWNQQDEEAAKFAEQKKAEAEAAKQRRAEEKAKRREEQAAKAEARKAAQEKAAADKLEQSKRQEEAATSEKVH